MGLKNSWFTPLAWPVPGKGGLRHGVLRGEAWHRTHRHNPMLPGSLQARDVVHFQGDTKHSLSGTWLGPKAGWDWTTNLCKLSLEVWPKHTGRGSLPIAPCPDPTSFSISNYPGVCFPPYMWFSIYCSWHPSASWLLASHPIKDLGLSISCLYTNLLAT